MSARAEHDAREQEAKLAGDYLKGAVLARTVSHEALELALTQIRAGTIKDPARTALNAATASGILLDKRLILEGRPTQIHAVDPNGVLNALARKVGLTLEGTCEDIEPPQLNPPEPTNQQNPRRPLQRERQSGKPRARARKKPAPKPAD